MLLFLLLGTKVRNKIKLMQRFPIPIALVRILGWPVWRANADALVLRL